MEVTHIDHAGLNVKDLQRSADWYAMVFGFDIIHKWNATWMVGCGLMRIGLFLRPQAEPVPDLDNKLAITHLAFQTDAPGFKALQVKLTELGIPFNPPDDTGIAFSIFISDPDGHEMEITTYHKSTIPNDKP